LHFRKARYVGKLIIDAGTTTQYFRYQGVVARGSSAHLVMHIAGLDAEASTLLGLVEIRAGHGQLHHWLLKRGWSSSRQALVYIKVHGSFYAYILVLLNSTKPTSE
jgi:hypothetical protein